jgi:hypothetical protein
MAKNNKPILSVLVDEEKKERFSALAKEHNYSMGWLLNQAIDKMLEAGTIHIYRDSIASASTSIAPSADIEELVRSYVDKAVTPLSNEYVQKNSWDDLRADVADLRDQLTQLLTTSKKPQPATIKTASTSSLQPNPETMKMVRRLQGNPKLRAAAEKGLAEGLAGKALCDWLFTQGYGANENANVFNPSVASNFRLAIEHLNTEGKTDGA